jgi:hypothetical protein
MSTTRIDQVDELTSVQFLSYIPPIEIKISASLMKPSTRYNLFFDGVNVNDYSKQEGKNTGEPIISDANGTANITIYLLGNKFTAGQKSIVLTQESTPNTPAGSNISRAETTFISYTTESLYNVYLEGNVVTISEALSRPNIIPVQPQVSMDDAIAQSFFTYGVQGGIFVTSIELFFAQKDNFLPVWVELREMVNGFPSKNFISPEAIAYKNAADVNVSSSASTSTKFTFNKLIYLAQDKDFCFVVRSRSNNYTLWSSRIGERSTETGNFITEQPFTGSLFKTDNNITWSTDQFEDIKFVLNRANFNTSVASTLKVPVNAMPVVADGTRLQTFNASNVLIIDFPHKHGLDTNSSIMLRGEATGKYNGATGTLLNGTHNVFKIISDYAFAVNVTGATFTKTGPIEYGGLIRNIVVTNGGSGYSTTSLPTVTISPPNETGTQATAVAVVENGVITRINVTNKGTGYTGETTVTITATTGSGATAKVVNNAAIGVLTNRVFNSVSPSLAYNVPPDTDFSAKLETTSARFAGSATTNYNTGPEYGIKVGAINNLDNNFLISSVPNETANMGGNSSCLFEFSMSSQNNKVSPIIDLNKSSFVFYNNRANNQTEYESLDAAVGSGSLQTITVTNGGSGYTSTPTVQIRGSGTGATATATISGGVVTGVTVTNGGTGFFVPPTILFMGGGTPTTKATATSTITKFNSELLPGNGSAATKYITKAQQLETPSTSIKLWATAYSNKDSSFEVYAKTSLSSSNIAHESQYWTKLSCDVTRNKSDRPRKELEYEFYVDGLPSFDIYSFKIVIRTQTPWDPPYVSNYRAVILA